MNISEVGETMQIQCLKINITFHENIIQSLIVWMKIIRVIIMKLPNFEILTNFGKIIWKLMEQKQKD